MQINKRLAWLQPSHKWNYLPWSHGDRRDLVAKLSVWKGLRSTPGGAGHPGLCPIFLGMVGVPKLGSCSLDSLAPESLELGASTYLQSTSAGRAGPWRERCILVWFQGLSNKNWFWLIPWDESIFTDSTKSSVMWFLNHQIQMLLVACFWSWFQIRFSISAEPDWLYWSVSAVLSGRKSALSF